MSVQFDLEQRIMQCWQVVDDLDVLFANVMDADPPSTHDEIANVLLGMKQLYDMKFYTLMSTYEKYIKEKHNEKTNYCGSPSVNL
jgi:hypothetical protein